MPLWLFALLAAGVVAGASMGIALAFTGGRVGEGPAGAASPPGLRAFVPESRTFTASATTARDVMRTATPSPTSTPSATATRTPTATPPPATPTPLPATTTQTAPPPATGTAGATIWSDGDSTSYFVTTAVFALAQERGITPVRAADYKINSGVVASGSSAVLGVPFGGWLTYVQQEMAAYDPSYVVFMVGANDWGVRDYDDYRRRVGQLMDAMQGRRVAWVGMPQFTVDYLASAERALNAIFAEEAAKRGWVTFVDTSAITPDGPDGTHFGFSGANAVAALVGAAILP